MLTLKRNNKPITFPLPPGMAEELRQEDQEEDRTVNKLLRGSIRLYMYERDWRRRERLEWLRSRSIEQQGGEIETV